MWRLVRVGEASGTLEHILKYSPANARAPRGCGASLRMHCAIRRLYYSLPIGVLVFFLMFVLPQFGAVLRDFGAKIDPIAGASFSDYRSS